MTDERTSLRWKYFTSLNSLIMMGVIFAVIILFFGFSIMAIISPLMIAFFYADGKAQSEIKKKAGTPGDDPVKS